MWLLATTTILTPIAKWVESVDKQHINKTFNSLANTRQVQCKLERSEKRKLKARINLKSVNRKNFFSCHSKDINNILMSIEVLP